MSLTRQDKDVMSGSAECISCRQPAAKLLEISQLAPLDYYRCNHCSHVWATYKGTTLLLEHLCVPRTTGSPQTIKPTA